MVQTPTDNPPAFPVPNDANVNGQEGMSLRDYLAAKALNGILANSYQLWVCGDYRTAGCVNDAYEFADAMLAARAQVAA